MPDAFAELEFLQKLDRYQEEKPYTILLGEDEVLDNDIPRTNLEFAAQPQVRIRDMRLCSPLQFDECGFEFQPHHQSHVNTFEAPEDVEIYKAETMDLLQRRFDAVHVHTYEFKLRQNSDFDRNTYDISNSLVAEGPAKGAHVDVTPRSGPEIVKRYLSPEHQRAYLRKGYRIRIINTWRPMNEVLEDCPLALCDSRTVADDDLAATDSVLPDRLGEIYYVHYSPRQQWYWLEKQKSTEPFIFLMYDTSVSKNSARLCPHVSFRNPRASPDAGIRSSVETRSIVISRAI